MLLNLICALAISIAFGQSQSSVRPAGLTIENAFYVGSTEDIVRGRTPQENEFEQLKNVGITDFLIIKNQTGQEIDKEKAALTAVGYVPSDVVQVDYRWKQIDQVVACQQTVQILEHIAAVEATSNRKLYFHCTAGVDRTGLIAGLYRLTAEPTSTLDGVFRSELCDRGYGDAPQPGGETRPPAVVRTIHTELTPIYLKFARALVRDRQDHFLNGDLTNICNPTYYSSPETENFVKEELPRHKCRK